MNINFNFFKKRDIREFLINQFMPAVLIITVGMYLVKGKISPPYALFSIIGLYYYSYFIHMFFHILPENINPHYLHHNNKKMSRVFNLLIETLTNILFFLILYVFQRIIRYDVFPNILILYYALIYISVHIINFSLFKIESHTKHHNKQNNTYCNYGPDSIDHFLNTNCDEKWENQIHYLPNILISYIVCSYLFNSKII